MQLNIYLHTDRVQDYHECLDEDLNSDPVHNSRSAKYKIYHVVNENREGPSWLKAIKNVIKPEIARTLTTKLCGVVIVFKIDTDMTPRYFSACFGIGHTLLDKSTIEHNFGLRTTLNSISRLRRCASQLLGARSRRKSIHAAEYARPNELDFDFDEEIMELASGRCRENDLGTTILGTDSLKLSSPIAFEEVPRKLAKIYARYNETAYRVNGFEFIDQIQSVRDSDLIDDLFSELLARFNDASDHSLNVLAPLDASGEDVHAYRLSGAGKSIVVPEVTLEALRDYAGKLDDDGLRCDVKIQGISSSDESVTVKSPLYTYITGEVTFEGEVYALANRKWYRLEKDYLDRIKNQLQKRMSVYRGPALLPWQKALVKGNMAHDEGEYNKSYEGNDDFLVLDKKKFSTKGYGSGNSVEVADLFHLPTRMLLCVKKNTRSSTLSHLFAQASVSAEMFSEVELYRERFFEQCREKWPSGAKARAVKALEPKDLTFAYVIGSETPPAKSTLADAVQDLPVFSRINLRKHVRAICSRGFSATVTYIKMV